MTATAILDYYFVIYYIFIIKIVKIPITHAPEMGAINRLHFSGAGFRCVCQRRLSGSGFVWYQIPAPIRTLFYSKPESDVRVTEMITYDWPMITGYVLMCFLVVI